MIGAVGGRPPVRHKFAEVIPPGSAGASWVQREKRKLNAAASVSAPAVPPAAQPAKQTNAGIVYTRIIGSMATKDHVAEGDPVFVFKRPGKLSAVCDLEIANEELRAIVVNPVNLANMAQTLANLPFAFDGIVSSTPSDLHQHDTHPLDATQELLVTVGGVARMVTNLYGVPNAGEYIYLGFVVVNSGSTPPYLQLVPVSHEHMVGKVAHPKIGALTDVVAAIRVGRVLDTKASPSEVTDAVAKRLKTFSGLARPPHALSIALSSAVLLTNEIAALRGVGGSSDAQKTAAEEQAKRKAMRNVANNVRKAAETLKRQQKNLKRAENEAVAQNVAAVTENGKDEQGVDADEAVAAGAAMTRKAEAFVQALDTYEKRLQYLDNNNVLLSNVQSLVERIVTTTDDMAKVKLNALSSEESIEVPKMGEDDMMAEKGDQLLNKINATMFGGESSSKPLMTLVTKQFEAFPPDAQLFKMIDNLKLTPPFQTVVEESINFFGSNENLYHVTEALTTANEMRNTILSQSNILAQIEEAGQQDVVKQRARELTSEWSQQLNPLEISIEQLEESKRHSTTRNSVAKSRTLQAIENSKSSLQEQENELTQALEKARLRINLEVEETLKPVVDELATSLGNALVESKVDWSEESTESNLKVARQWINAEQKRLEAAEQKRLEAVENEPLNAYESAHAWLIDAMDKEEPLLVELISEMNTGNLVGGKDQRLMQRLMEKATRDVEANLELNLDGTDDDGNDEDATQDVEVNLKYDARASQLNWLNIKVKAFYDVQIADDDSEEEGDKTQLQTPFRGQKRRVNIRKLRKAVLPFERIGQAFGKFSSQFLTSLPSVKTPTSTSTCIRSGDVFTHPTEKAILNFMLHTIFSD
jgi:hypothetical protein